MVSFKIRVINGNATHLDELTKGVCVIKQQFTAHPKDWKMYRHIRCFSRN